jgi:hypothetical protein
MPLEISDELMERLVRLEEQKGGQDFPKEDSPKQDCPKNETDQTDRKSQPAASQYQQTRA